MDSILTSSAEGLGRLFYVVNPYKTSFRTTDEVPHYVSQAAAWFITLIILERLILRKAGKNPPINDGLASISCGLVQEINHLAFRGTQTAAYVYIYEHFRLYELPWDSIWTWILCALGMDLGYYWAHRATHEVNLFWSQHQVHHSSEEYNLTTALRQGMWQGWTTLFFYLPMAFFIPPSQFFAHAQFNLLYQFWIHTEVIDSLGPLEWILNTPSHHRVHHGSARYCIDKNYAGVLIIWDRIFGTFEAEKKDEAIVYGLIDQVDSFNPIYLELFYLKKVFDKVRSVSGFGNKFKALFYGPGWFPGTPRLGDYDQLPEKIVREKISRKITPQMQLYAALHYVILTLIYQHLATHVEEIDSSVVYGSCVFIVFSIWSLGLLLNESKLFPWVEIARCLVFLGYQFYSPIRVEDFWLNAALYAVRLFYLYSAWHCRILYAQQTALTPVDHPKKKLN